MCCSRRSWRAGKLRDYIYCVFAFVFTYCFMPAIIVFELAWSLLLASSSVKTFTFMVTGSHSIYQYGNMTVVDDSAITPPEIALGGLVMLVSGIGMAIFMWLRAKAKREGRRGQLLVFKVNPASIPLSLRHEDAHEMEMRKEVEQDTFSAFIEEGGD